MGTDTTYNLDQKLIPVPKSILTPSEKGQNYLPMSNLEERLNMIANKAELKKATSGYIPMD